MLLLLLLSPPALAVPGPAWAVVEAVVAVAAVGIAVMVRA